MSRAKERHRTELHTSDPRSGTTIPQLISSTPLAQEKPACSTPHRACLGPASYHTSHGVPFHLADTSSALLFFKRREGKMKSSLLLCLALAISMGLILVAGYPRDPEDKEYVLVNNKCKCVTMTSKFVPSKENPDEEILVRNIRIIVPLKARENISDPTSPLRTKFVYRMTDLCKKCDPVEVNLGGESYQTQPSSSCSDPEICYTYNRDKCYTTTLPFLYHGKVKNVPVALTPTSCYAD
ncbi:immunoglobulin J chain isoform X2 [Calypte anna]|uniref:immunoglobulin J chain isoform X2 n=1 Tax=Calypte anna TaxID=9244 RepID=UPI0011C43BBD|nr:immunoglobulin J chain isoform X2 [Calypte anna]